MKLGVFTVLFADMTLGETVDYLKALGVQAVELGTGGYPGDAHCKPAELLADPGKLGELRKTIEDAGMVVSALSCHGNPVHPQAEIASRFHKDFEDTVLLAEKLGVRHVVTFSGCPGGAPGDRTPNWVTCPWPGDYTDTLKYQWEDVLIPYWTKTAKFCADHGVDKIALEMHPGFSVYNPETMLRLRAATSQVVGANFDPSHLFWQGIDAGKAVRYLGDAVHYVHAKDTKIDALNTDVAGVLDTKTYTDEINRSWVFRSVGYGHGADIWRDIVSNLRLIGYDHVMSIEHEDSLMSPAEGLKKAIALLKDAMIFEDSGEAYWA